mgnify:CR=1 FL=1
MGPDKVGIKHVKPPSFPPPPNIPQYPRSCLPAPVFLASLFLSPLCLACSLFFLLPPLSFFFSLNTNINLVEQQDVGGHKERRGQGHTHAPATGQLLGW